MLFDVREKGPGAMADVMVTKEELVARHVRRLVVSGQMTAGTRIRQQQLADELGVSPTPVREALRSLVSEGWLVSVPHIGVSVAGVKSEGLDEIFTVRQMLEGYLAEEAARRMTDDVLDQLRRLNRQFDKAFRRKKFIEARRINYEFHLLIWETACCPVTLGIVNGLWAKFPWNTLGSVAGRGERTVHEHDDLVAALAERDAARAGKAILVHMQSGRADLELALSPDVPLRKQPFPL